MKLNFQTMKKFVAMFLCFSMIASFANMQGLCVSADANTTETTTEEVVMLMLGVMLGGAGAFE